jgi:thymidine phosphorylase
VINPDVGVDALARRGEHQEAGTILCRVHAASEAAAAEALERMTNAFELSPEPPTDQPLILDVI